jgi:hypothetical protein
MRSFGFCAGSLKVGRAFAEVQQLEGRASFRRIHPFLPLSHPKRKEIHFTKPPFVPNRKEDKQ